MDPRRTAVSTGLPLLMAILAVVLAVLPVRPTFEPSVIARLERPVLAHQGFETVIRGRVVAEDAVSAVVRFGDGQSAIADLSSDGTFEVRHAYTGGGSFDVQLIAAGQEVAVTSATVEVAPRVVLFVQGINSRSSCPDGQHFLDGGPAWMREALESDAGGLQLSGANFAYFSYSGDFCSAAGASAVVASVPNYGRGATCGSIATNLAPRLREQVELYAPSRVSIVAHSMGGVVAAYTVASDPEWAAEHIASVATFDSPLGGVDGMRSRIFAAVSGHDGGCGKGSHALKDLREGSDVLRVAAAAAQAVPFFTLDGNSNERGALGLAEAVPGDSASLEGAALAWSVGGAHSGVWQDSAVLESKRARFVVCAVVVKVQCEAEGS